MHEAGEERDARGPVEHRRRGEERGGGAEQRGLGPVAHDSVLPPVRPKQEGALSLLLLVLALVHLALALALALGLGLELGGSAAEEGSVEGSEGRRGRRHSGIRWCWL